jgi:uncharacterized protein YyaL (SSP411 family)
MPNRLAAETSPYLLQHADNPVDWHAWGDEAWTRARSEDKPVLVSIGYSACHWCHVMERESFEDPEVAALMNERFVCIKVDREERPDVDAIYMDAVQAMTGHGGWPLNAFTTPEQVPFYAGTYFPPRSRGGLPAWPQVLAAVADAWNDRGGEIRSGAERIVEHLKGGARLRASGAPLDPGVPDAAVAALRQSFDARNGGFGGAPKFPPHSVLEFLLGQGETEMSLGTLRAMGRGGIFDQLGGGFARYTVDATWTVPHFEKMLYDNALLARAYLHGWLVSGDRELRDVCERTLGWALAEMRGPEGGFFSALDADSEGVEGRYYVWTADELREILGPERAERATEFFGATERGNFEGANILVRARDEPPEDLEEIRATLLEVRATRVRPGLDDKRLTSWNALMVSALADAGAALDRPDFVQAASACAGFLLESVRDADGRLLRSWKDGRARIMGYLEDHAYLLEALLTLYEATFDPRWFEEARTLADGLLERFADPEHGAFFSTPVDGEELVARRKDLEDNPIPSGNSAAALGLLRLAALTGEGAYAEAADGVIALLHPVAAQHPQAFGHLLQAIAFALGPVHEVALVGGDIGDLARVVRARHRPRVVVAAGEPEPVPLMAGRGPVDGRPAAYVCERFACRTPVTEPAELAAALGD